MLGGSRSEAKCNLFVLFMTLRAAYFAVVQVCLRDLWRVP